MATESSVMAVIRAARPAFRNSHDKIVFALHASFLSAGYVLQATGDQAVVDDASMVSASGQEVGVDGWNKFEDYYGFVYSKVGANAAILVKCLAVEDKLEIDALMNCDQRKEPVHLEVSVSDYVSVEGNDSTSYGEMYKNLAELVYTFNSFVLVNFENTNNDIHSRPSARLNGSELENQTRVPSELETSTHIVYPPLLPGGVGDLYPMPGAGFYPTRSGSGSEGGMLVGPNDPRWHGMVGINPELNHGIPGVPPGARFDPYGPPGVPGFEPGRFVRQPPKRPGGSPHPDLQHFRDPPSYL